MSGISEAEAILHQLKDNLIKPPSEHDDKLLAQLKVFTRDLATIQKIFDRELIDLLARYGLERGQSNEALRCLANILLQIEASRQVFVDSGFAMTACDALKECSFQREFLLCRILFLLTYKTNLNLEELDREHMLCENITQLCHKHEASPNKTLIEQQALDELLKLLFNITHFSPNLVGSFSQATGSIVKFMITSPIPTPPLQAPITSVINALLNMDLISAVTSEQGSIDSSTISAVVNRLVDIFDKSIRKYTAIQLDTAANPLCTLLRKINDTGDQAVHEQLKQALLPQDRDRGKPLGEGDTLAAHLLRTSVSPEMASLGNNISSLLFELSEKDPDQFVNNIGYGFASGFLFSHGMTAPVPSNNVPTNMDPVNPVTGQRLTEESEDHASLEEMTEEEKEQEAERLFVLFERLKATGVVDVKNPVERLYEQGN